MAYDRDDDFRSNHARDREQGRDFGSGRDYTHSGARDHRAAGEADDRNFRGGGTGYGDRDYRPNNQGGRETFGQDQDYYGGRSQPDHGRSGYGSAELRGSRFADTGGDRGRQPNRGGYGRQPQGYD